MSTSRVSLPDTADRLFALADAAVAMAQAATHADALRILTERARLLVGAHQAITSLVAPDRSFAVRATSFSPGYGEHAGA
jgi:hypothetical protein